MEIENISGNAGSCCIYTTLIGDYEHLNEQPVAAQSDIPFICLTDSPALRSETWACRVVTPVFPRDPIRSQRELKIRAHVALPEFDRSIYIDNSILLRQPPERLLDFMRPGDEFLLAPHSFRDTVLDEFLEVSRLGYDDTTRIFEQLNHYTLSCPAMLEERPWWTGLMIRDHRSPRVRAVLEQWAAHVMRYARRDQLSVNVAFRAAGLAPTALPLDVIQSDFHSWPHTTGRDRARGGRDPAASQMPLGARVRELEQLLADREAAIATLQNAHQGAEALRKDCERLSVETDTLRAEAQRLHAEAAAERAAREQEAAAHREEVEQLAAAAMRHEADAVRLAAALVELSSRHDAVLASTSWRITAPLRA
ncbi:MAG TPA: hypothetical protein VN702_11230, partial [Acetobacteraceae bacterium]|nr:hypothetical protein [Acetobacteraceae bacterium]